MVRRIFDEYLDGNGDRAIANGLNRDGIPCPSARRPEQNRHRLADGWQGSTVRSVLENPRYTGYASFGRWQKHETLLDPDDVAAGHVTRFRRSKPERVVRSREPAHPTIVPVAMFTRAQLLRRSQTTGGLATCAEGRARRPTYGEGLPAAPQRRWRQARRPWPTIPAYVTRPPRNRSRCLRCLARFQRHVVPFPNNRSIV